MTLNMVCQEVGVSRDTLHRWRNETPEFQTALEKAIKDRWKSAESLAVNTMINLAAEGNFQAVKYMLDNLGYKAPDKIEANVKNDVVIRIGYDDDA